MARPLIEIDSESGFCFGVTTAISKAEEHLADGALCCLGDIVHNSAEVERLRQRGLRTITHEDLGTLHDAKVLLRAHGEPPETYRTAHRNNITIIDATCPVVLRLQQRIKHTYDAPGGARPQIVIYGKNGHAEVNGLVGQTEGTAIVVEDIDGLEAVDFTRPVALYSQTTKSIEGFHELVEEIRRRMTPGVDFQYYDTICRQVANRVQHLREFARNHDVVFFVAGTKSSNGKVLSNHCRQENPHTYLVANEAGIKTAQLRDAGTIGICGATSTPRWLMENVYRRIEEIINE